MEQKHSDSELAYIVLGLVGLGALLWFTQRSKVETWFVQAQTWMIEHGILVGKEAALISVPGIDAGLDVSRLIMLIGLLLVGLGVIAKLTRPKAN